MKKLIITTIISILILTSCTDSITYKSHNSSYYPYLEFSVDHKAKRTYVTIVEEVDNVLMPAIYQGYPTRLIGVLSPSVKGPEVTESIKNSISTISLSKDYFEDHLDKPHIIQWKNLKHFVLLDGVDEIGTWDFYGWRHIKSITMSDSVLSIGVTAFNYCESLEKVTIGDGVKILSMGTFKDCFSLKDVTLGKNIEVLEVEAFGNCRSLSSIELPKNLKTIGFASFNNCISLEEIIIPNSVTKIEHLAFRGCTSLKSISLPAGTYDLSSFLPSGDWSVNGEKITDLTNFVATDRKLITRTI